MKRQDNDYAVSWIREYEVAHILLNLGHNSETFCNPMALQHFLNDSFALATWLLTHAQALRSIMLMLKLWLV